MLVVSLLAGMGIFVVCVGLGTVLAFVATNSTDARNPSTALLAALLFVNALASVLAGLATGKMTRANSLYTVLLLALMLTMSSLVPVLRGTTNGEPAWFLAARCALVFAGILAGGALQRLGGRAPETA
jgi:hypothetical protein